MGLYSHIAHAQCHVSVATVVHGGLHKGRGFRPFVLMHVHLASRLWVEKVHCGLARHIILLKLEKETSADWRC